MRGAARTGDDELEPALLGRRGIVVKALRRAVGGDDLRLVGDAELVERFGGMAHRLPVGAAAHDDADQRLGHRPALKQLQKGSSFRGAIRGRQRSVDSRLADAAILSAKLLDFQGFGIALCKLPRGLARGQCLTS